MASITQPRAGVQSAERARTESRARLRKALTYAVLVVVCLMIVFPIYWMLTISLKTPRDIYR
ncbi:MAG: hypothetical protein LC748_15395, partial [Thermomicrobia bacterium]|nr:hypothetical protein [Thermomicrobia bacterium]